jgi:hypothetical protein
MTTLWCAEMYHIYRSGSNFDPEACYLDWNFCGFSWSLYATAGTMPYTRSWPVPFEFPNHRHPTIWQ